MDFVRSVDMAVVDGRMGIDGFACMSARAGVVSG